MAVIKGSLRLAVNEWLKELNITSAAKDGVKSYVEDSETELIDLLIELYTQLGVYDLIPDNLKPKQTGITGKRRQVETILLAQSASQVGGGISSSILSPVFSKIQQSANSAIPNTLVPESVAIEVMRRFPQHRINAINALGYRGYDDTAIEMMSLADSLELSASQILSLHLRKEIELGETFRRLLQLGYDKDRQAELIKLTEVIPPIPDLIRMAVREAFNPEAIRRFHLDANFPSDILPATKAQGLSDEWVEKYWAAHWQLPSIEQGFEMFRRLRKGQSNVPFEHDDLQSLMIANDIPEFFRDRLLEIAYNPLTRVDVRRMYQTGHLTVEEVKDAYLDAGYSPENAERLRDWTVAEFGEESEEITRGMLLNAFKKGLLDEGQVTKMLLEIGIPSHIVLFVVAVASFEKELAERDEEIEFLTLQYLEGFIGENDLLNGLNRLNLPGHETQAIILKTRRKKLGKTALATRTEIDKWYSQGVVGDADYRLLLQQRGYRDIDINRFLSSLKIEMGEDRAKELERLAKENARVIGQKAASAFQKAVAQINVNIAETKVAIANAKIARDGAGTEREKSELDKRIDRLEKDVVVYRQEIANVKLASEQ